MALPVVVLLLVPLSLSPASLALEDDALPGRGLPAPHQIADAIARLPSPYAQLSSTSAAAAAASTATAKALGAVATSGAAAAAAAPPDPAPPLDPYEDEYPTFRLREEAGRPIPRPDSVTPCVVTLARQQNYSSYFAAVPLRYSPPPTGCYPGYTPGAPWERVVALAKLGLDGPQYDRRLTFSLAGRVLLVATTQQYSRPGVKFNVERDLTVYQKFLGQPLDAILELPNPVSQDLPGVFYVTFHLLFYPGTPASPPADVVLPAPYPTAFKAPRNVYKAEAELFISHYGSDEFYYTNVPTRYFNSLSPNDQSLYTNGSTFREVLLSLDGRTVAAFAHQPLLYTGGFHPYLWRPFMGIGSLIMPVYRADLTPFVPWLIKPQWHQLRTKVTNAPSASLWYANGTLLLWRDPVWRATRGTVKRTQVSKLSLSETISVPVPGSPNVLVTTSAFRQYRATGVVFSSLGRITTDVRRKLNFRNVVRGSRDGLTSTVDYIAGSQTVVETRASDDALSGVSVHTAEYPLSVLSEYLLLPASGYAVNVRVDHSSTTNLTVTSPRGVYFDIESNTQTTAGTFSPPNPNYSLNFVAGQVFNYSSSEGCYLRAVETSINLSGISFGLDNTNTTCGAV